MSSAAAAPWESPWPRRPPLGPLLLLVLLASCAAPARCAGASTTPATPARPASTPAPPVTSQAQGAALERYRRLIPYMTYYVAQGLTQSRSPALPAALQTVHNGLDAYSPPPGRLRGGAGGGYLLPTYVVRPAPAAAAPPRTHGAAHSAAPAAGQPPRTLFRFDFQQGQQRPGKVRDQPFLPSPPLTPDNKDSDDYFKPVTDTANYYRGVAAPAAPAPTAAPEQHLVVFPEDDARLRAKLRQQQRKQNQHQLLLQQHQSQQQQLLDDAYRLKLLVLQQQQLQQAKEFRAQLQAQRLREQLRAHHQQEHEVRALVQAQQAKRHREQQQQLQLQAQFQAQQQAQDLKKLREQQLRQDQELQAQLQVQAQVQQQAEDAKAVQALREQQLQVRIRAHELKKLRAQQARQQQDQELQAQLQAQQAKQDEELRAHVEEQRALQRHKAQREHALRPFRVHEHADRPADAPAPASAPASAPSNDADTEVEQQVVVSLEEVEKMLPPSAAGSDAPSGPAHTEVLVEPEVQPSARPDHPDAVQAKPVVYAEEAAIAPVAQNVAPPSSSRELVAHLINGLQLSNKLPQTLTPDNFDMSLKTILQLLKILHKSKAPDGPVTTPAKVKVSPESPERDTSFYIGGGTVSQTFPAPSVEGSTPGRPGIDYPAYDSIPQTKFSCATQRYKGFFGDPETNCQVWHYCDLNGGQASFLCPNGTIFSQVGLTCDWWFNVRCASTAQLYVLNERLYKYILPVKPSFPEDYSGPDVDRYLTEKFREMQAKARGRKEKLKAKENKGAAATDASEQPEESVETNQTEDHEAPKSSEVVKEKEVEEQQKLDPDL